MKRPPLGGPIMSLRLYYLVDFPSDVRSQSPLGQSPGFCWGSAQYPGTGAPMGFSGEGPPPVALDLQDGQAPAAGDG